MKKIFALVFASLLLLTGCGVNGSNLPEATLVDISAIKTAAVETAFAGTNQTATANVSTVAPLPTETPLPLPTSTPEPQPLNLSGTGDSILDVSAWGEVPGLIIIEGNSGSGYFGITPYDKDGNRIPSIVNTGDPFNGICPFNFDGKYATRLEIKATGNWTIRIAPLSEARTLSVPGSIEGSGDEVIILTGGTPDLATITGNAESKYFGIIPYRVNGERMSSLVNGGDPYQGTVVVKKDTVIIEIKAGGKWSISLTATQ